ncbi:hypothetical protein ACIQC9_03035 [Brevundimonas sp. NPDC092305]|uniref:hypothetical protein n=1 Tax=Brevundimonas sp. NPDC092305 TaxID=3363957 RepID=UPI0037F39621
MTDTTDSCLGGSMGRRPNPFQYDDLLEDHPAILASELNRRGVFDDRSLETFVLDVDGRSIEIKYLADVPAVFTRIRWGRKVKEQVFPIKTVENTFGTRYLFRCGYTKRPVTALYLNGGELRSRHALQLPYTSRAGWEEREQLEAQRLCRRLAGTDGRGPARQPNKGKIVSRLNDLARRGAYLTPQARAVLLRSLEEQQKPGRKVRRASEKVGTQAAAKRQRRSGYISPHIIVAGLLEWVQTARKRSPTKPAGRVTTSPNDFIDRYPSLLLSELNRMNKFDPENLWAEALLWDLPTATLRTHVCVDRKFERHFAIVRSFEGEVENTQTVDIVYGQQKNPKPYFVCPVLGIRTEGLYYRDGRFGSAKAQRLLHRSQRGKRSLWRPDSLR